MADKISLDDNNGNSEYEPTDSEDEYSEEEKELLRNVRESNRREVDEKKQIMAFDSSDSEEEDDDDDGPQIEDSDIEGAGGADDAEGLPDAMDWGDKSRNYYHTDFVDRDYDEYNEQELEMAQHEEEEAKTIQQRLLKQMNESDFQLDAELLKDAEAQADALDDETTKIKTDLSGLSEREKQRLFAEESPEFEGITASFVPYMKEQRDLIIPVLKYIRDNNAPMIPAFQFAQDYQKLVFTYCTNVAFYLLLKAKRVPIRSHPVIKRLLSMQQMLTQLNDRYENIIKPQFEALLERIQDGDEFEILEIKPASKKQKRSKLNILKEFEPETELEAPETQAEQEEQMDIDNSDNEDAEADEEDEELEEGDNRRGITYQIAKNKGLTPHRKKELRNPRVKHRSKFRKALIKRKGAVRTVRKETKRYGGEISGIKSTVSKSIKFKV